MPCTFSFGACINQVARARAWLFLLISHALSGRDDCLWGGWRHSRCGCVGCGTEEGTLQIRRTWPRCRMSRVLTRWTVRASRVVQPSLEDSCPAPTTHLHTRVSNTQAPHHLRHLPRQQVNYLGSSNRQNQRHIQNAQAVNQGHGIRRNVPQREAQGHTLLPIRHMRVSIARTTVHVRGFSNHRHLHFTHITISLL